MNKRIFAFFLLAGLITSHTYAADARKLEDGTATAGTAKVNSSDEDETASLRAHDELLARSFHILSITSFLAGSIFFIGGVVDSATGYDRTNDVGPESGQRTWADDSFAMTHQCITGLAFCIVGQACSLIRYHISSWNNGK